MEILIREVSLYVDTVYNNCIAAQYLASYDQYGDSMYRCFSMLIVYLSLMESHHLGMPVIKPGLVCIANASL